MKSPIVLVTLLVILAGFLLSDVTGTSASVANTSIRDNKVTSSQSEGNNSTATATITITMTPTSLPDE